MAKNVEVELYDLNARYYDPSIARFLTEDPYYNLGNRVMGVYEINVPNVYSIMQANALYAYSGNNPIMFVDPFGTTVTLTGITSEDDPRFVALQELTDDELTVDFLSGQVSIVTEAEGEELIRPTGTNLVRDLVNDEEVLQVVLTDGVSEATAATIYDENGNMVGLDNFIINFNSNQDGSVMTIKGARETPNLSLIHISEPTRRS